MTPSASTLSQPAGAATQQPNAAPIPPDRISELYRGEIFNDELARVARDRIHWMCAQCDGDNVLDVGCSQGVVAILLAREGASVTAIDTHPESIAFALRDLAQETSLVQGRVKLLESDLASLPESRVFDTVVLGEVLEHQAMPERFLRAAASRLRIGGRLVITTPFAYFPHDDHKISVMPSQIVAIANRLGLTVSHLEVVDQYIRAVLLGADAGGLAPAAPIDVLAITEQATVASQKKLYDRIATQSARLKKLAEAPKTGAAKTPDARTDRLQLPTPIALTATAVVPAVTGNDALRIANEAHRMQMSTLQSRLQLELKSANEKNAKAQVALRSELKKEYESRLADKTAKALAEAARAYQREAGALTRRIGELDAQRLALKTSLEALRLTYTYERTHMRKQVTLLRAKIKAIRAASSHRLGRALVQGVKSPRALLSLPSEIWAIVSEGLARRKARHSGETPAETYKEVVAPSPEQAKALEQRPDLSVASLVERVQVTSVAEVCKLLVDQAGHLGKRTAAVRMIQLGKALAEKDDLTGEMHLVRSAMALERTDATLRAFFWAAQRSQLFEEACAAIEELHALYGPHPRPEQSTLLDKLKASPAYQLSLLSLLKDRPPARVDSIAGRVCYVLHNSLPFSSGGYATRSHGVAVGLAATGREVIVLTRPGFPRDAKGVNPDQVVATEETIDGIRYVRTLAPLRRDNPLLRYVTEAADALEQRLREYRPALVMAASNHVTALPALIAARRLGLPFVYEVRGLWEITRISRDQEFEQTAAFAIQRLLESRVAQAADHVFTLTEPMREELVARGLDAGHVELLPNSCDPERFVPRPRDAALARKLGLADSVPVIGYVGTFVDYEGLDDLALACTLLKKRGIKFCLMLVGNENASGAERGPITEQIQFIADNEGFTASLVMPGRVPHDEVEAYYSLIDIAPFPRKPWPVCEMVSPMKPLEALAMEKAVVVSSVRALTEMIADGRTGRVFEKGSVVSLADTLADLIKDVGQRGRLGRAGRVWVAEERTWRKIGRQLDQRLTTLIDASRDTPRGLAVAGSAVGQRPVERAA